MPEKNDKAGKMKEPEKVFRVVFPAHHDASIIIEPSEEPLDFPPFLIAPKNASILRLVFDAATASVRCDDLGAVFRKNFLVQSVAIVGLVSDDPFSGGSGTNRSSMVWPTSVTSAGEALAVLTAIGRPWLSVIAMILVPFPRLVFPTQRPLFWPGRTCHR